MELDYNPRLSIWYGVDPLTEKMPSWSPYSYTFDNPINFIDPDGREPIGGSGGPGPKKGGVRFILNLAADPDMYDAAKTRMKQIRNNYPNDKIVELTESNLGKLSGVVKNELAKAKKEGYGKTYELSVFSHAGTDGPVGSFDPKNTYDLSVESGEATDKGQMSLEGWSKINWNFDSGNSVAAFYGCQSDAFAEKVMGISDVFYTAGVGGRAGGSKVISGDFSGTIANSFGLSSGDVYLRSQTDGKVDPLTVYRRGHTEKVTQPDKSTRRYLKPIEYYRNATVPSK